MQTVFYVAGGALVLAAFLISFFGLRSETFPSNGVLRLGVAVFALVVGLTAYAAVTSAGDEQNSRRDEANREAAVAEDKQTADNQASGEGALQPTAQGGGSAQAPAPGPRDQTDSTTAGDSSASTPVTNGDPKAGAMVFADQNCGSCHTLAEAPTGVGQIGPNLDEALSDKDANFIKTSIVDPGAYVEKGFADGIMPVDYGDVIPPTDLANLVAFLSASTSTSSK